MTRPPTQLEANQLARAHAQLQAGDLVAAERSLQGLLAQSRPLAAALHLRALIARAAGDLSGARHWFERALAVDARNPELHNNYANLLDKLGEGERAISHFHSAVKLRPDYAQAWLNLGIVAGGLGRLATACDALRKALNLNPALLPAWRALVAALRRAGDATGAWTTIEQALQRFPDDARLLHARASLAAARGDSGARDFYVRASAVAPDATAIALGAAVAAYEDGETERALDDVCTLAERHAGDSEVQAMLARMRWEIEGPDGFDRGYADAADRGLLSPPLLTSWIATLSAAGQHERVLATVARHAPGDSHFVLAAAIAASESGDTLRAAQLFAQCDEQTTAARIARARHALRCSEAELASRIAADVTRADPGNQLGWAYLQTSWRLLGDARHGWLVDLDTMVRSIDLPLSPAEIDAIATALRRLHRTRVHPFDQSLRSGTQTNGELFEREDENVRRLQGVLRAAVATYIAGLPPADASHPLLGQRRGDFYFAGAWSVRLGAQGFHINHVHPEGWISSACYLALPDCVGSAADRAGWLTLGQPPVELATGLAPLGYIEPVPGRLALFPSFLWHGTMPFSDGERLTAAFDVKPLL